MYLHGRGCCPGLRETTLEAVVVGEISMTVVLSEKATAKIPLVSLVQYTLSSSSARLEAGRPGGREEEGRGREGGKEDFIWTRY